MNMTWLRTPLISSPTLCVVAVKAKPLSAAELDVMTPDERAHALVERTVIDLDDLPPVFRARVEETGRRLAAEIPAQPPG